MSGTQTSSSGLHRPAGEGMPALWFEPAPEHFDLRVAWWIKMLVVVLAAVGAYFFVDARVAAWVMRTHPIPDFGDPKARHGDVARELMMLEQWGQWTASVLVVAAVALLDKAGRRQALSIAVGCLVTVAVTYLIKDLCGRSRPWVQGDGGWIWGGPGRGFTGGSSWTSFPSAHTTGAFALSAGLAWFYPRGRGLFMGLAVITAAQRVLHGAHFVSDTIAGMGIAVFVMRWSLGRGKLAGMLIGMAPPKVRDWWMAGKS